MSGNSRESGSGPSLVRVQDLYVAALRHHQAGQLAEAEKLYRRILAINPNHGKSLHHLGLIAHQMGKSDIAIGLIEQAIAMNKREPTFHHNIAEALRAVGRIGDAVVHYKKAIALKSGDVDTLVGLGIALKALGKLDEAAVQYRRALVYNPNSPEAHNNLGRLLAEQGELEQAIEHFEKTAALWPNRAMPYMNLGNALQEHGRLEDALVAYRQALVLQPAYPEALMNLGSALYEQGKLEEAVAHYLQALELKPQLAEAHNNLGKTLLRMGKLMDAEVCFERALHMLPDHPDPALNLCAAIDGLSLENRDQAVGLAQKFVQLYPKNALLKRGLAGILATDIDAAHENAYIKTVFDTFAGSFDKRLSSLHYDMPRKLADALGLVDNRTGTHLDILDAGCGTGLCGEYLRPVARSLTGVDLSTKMLAKARALSVYDHLVDGDIVEYMRANVDAFDMVISSDVLPYMGDLHNLVSALNCTLRQGGVFAASAESLDHEGGSGDYKLAPSGRYKHSKRYLNSVLSESGFTVKSFLESVGRLEWGRPVTAWIVIAAKAEASTLIQADLIGRNRNR